MEGKNWEVMSVKGIGVDFLTYICFSKNYLRENEWTNKIKIKNLTFKIFVKTKL